MTFCLYGTSWFFLVEALQANCSCLPGKDPRERSTPVQGDHCASLLERENLTKAEDDHQIPRCSEGLVGGLGKGKGNELISDLNQSTPTLNCVSRFQASKTKAGVASLRRRIKKKETRLHEYENEVKEYEKTKKRNVKPKKYDTTCSSNEDSDTERDVRTEI